MRMKIKMKKSLFLKRIALRALKKCQANYFYSMWRNFFFKIGACKWYKWNLKKCNTFSNKFIFIIQIQHIMDQIATKYYYTWCITGWIWAHFRAKWDILVLFLIGPISWKEGLGNKWGKMRFGFFAQKVCSSLQIRLFFFLISKETFC